MADIRLPDINGFIILNEAVKKNVPMIMMSANEDAIIAKMALQNGAMFFLQKPLNGNVIKSLWQHVVVARMVKDAKVGEKNRSLEVVNDEGDSEDSSETVSLDLNKVERISKNKINNKKNGISKKIDKNKAGTAWTEELHEKFVAATVQLGQGNCYPKDILELMNVPGLTRMQVASHLQKCRDGLWRGAEVRKPITASVPSNSGCHRRSRNFGAMPPLAKLPMLPPQSVHATEGNNKHPELCLPMGPTSPDTATSSRCGTNTPTNSSSSGSSAGNKFFNLIAKVGETNGALKIYSPKKGPGAP